MRARAWFAGAAIAAALAGAEIAPAAAQAPKLVFGLPPIFASTMAAVGDGLGFFKKYGGDVEVKFFDASTPRAQALISGDIDVNLAFTPITVSQISNADADLVAIYGMPVADFLIASADPARTKCQDLKGQSIGVDAVGGTRAIALQQMLASCGLKLEDVELVALTGNANAAALIAGRLNFSVLHSEEVPVVEGQGRRIAVVADYSKLNANNHYLLVVVRRADLARNREAYVRMMAGLIDAIRFIQDAKHDDRVAGLTYPIGLSPEQIKGALRRYVALGFWPVDNDGLERTRLEAAIAAQAASGAIKPGKTPVPYDRLVDRSIWRDAAKLVKP